MDEKQLLRIREIALRLGLEPPKNPEEFLKKANEQSAYSSVSTESEQHWVGYTKVDKILEELIVQEGYSVGLFKIGMHKEEVEKYLAYYKENYNTYENSFSFEYDEDGKVTFIHLNLHHIRPLFYCNFKGIDIFNTKATELIEFLENISPYIKNNDSAFGFHYDFPELGLKFWRGETCTEEEIKTDWFKELDPDIQEDNKRFLYFETVTFFKTI